jgi:Transposase DDE domain
MCTDDLIKTVRESFGGIKDYRSHNCTYSLTDTLMGAFSIFHLKDPSLLAFREQFDYRRENLKQIYGLEKIPQDSGLRKCLDGLNPALLRPVFKVLLNQLRNAKVLEEKRVLGDYLAVSGDGTGYFCTTKNDCAHCLTRHLRNGEVQYHHQLLAACIVHPGQNTVFPVAAEAIVRQDGAEKNDCERNAAKRLFPQIRQILPTDKIILLLDALYADGPTLRALKAEQFSFFITLKEGYALLQAQRLQEAGKLEELIWYNGKSKCIARWTNDLIFNGQNQDILVNYLQYQEVNKTTGELLYHNEWITDLTINKDQVQEMVQVARARWKIENETFNTLKNQGYHLEHNYGHGKQFLSTVFAMLMLLAFLVDQVAQFVDTCFQKAMAKFKTRKAFWHRVAAAFDVLPCMSMNSIYRFIAGDIQFSLPKLE